MKPRVLLLSGYGINCEEETAFAFEKAGADTRIVHVNDLIEKPQTLKNADVLAFPGGFSYGDDTGSGNALANKIRNNLWPELLEFLDNEKLVIGICNGFQVLVNLGLLPGIGKKYGERKVALGYNNSCRYEDRWVELESFSKKCVFTAGIDSLRLPVAHGEGKFTASTQTLQQLNKNNQIVFRYSKDGSLAKQEFPFNPNGALEDIAGICDESGRVFGLMPHPERNIVFTQQDNWTFLKEKLKREGKKIPEESDGMNIFRNAVEFFR